MDSLNHVLAAARHHATHTDTHTHTHRHIPVYCSLLALSCSLDIFVLLSLKLNSLQAILAFANNKCNCQTIVAVALHKSWKSQQVPVIYLPKRN